MTLLIVAVAGLLIVLAVGARLMVRRLRSRQMANQACGDWWPRFEEAFREYAGGSPGRPGGADGPGGARRKDERK